MAAQQRRLITAANSKLGKVDLVHILRSNDAWDVLPYETREHLCSLLPEPKDGELSHDPDANPLTQSMKYHIEAEVRRWQDDLKEGRETKKWRDEATQAGHDRGQGKFDQLRDVQREEYWGSEALSGGGSSSSSSSSSSSKDEGLTAVPSADKADE